ncbi:MAG: 23S rRNA (pseudouridine(1915)-N(3))-methyltransferase RlmH [Chlamydiales bacterium]|nr:23S rRNA (pseudouridine(1915)-N(3))-methyltransferase RlmH [Chlamydiales bacterium]
MLRIKLLMVGRSKEPWIDSGVLEFERRMSSTLQLSTEWLKDDQQLVQQIGKEDKVVCLDPNGKTYTSEEFAKSLSKWLEDGGSRLTLVIGGAEGLPQSLKRYPLLSLSSLTYTHQMCRLILAEQLYRATEIWRGSPYHK